MSPAKAEQFRFCESRVRCRAPVVGLSADDYSAAFGDPRALRSHFPGVRPDIPIEDESMEQRRFVSFILTSLIFVWLWTSWIGPRFFPQPKPIVEDTVAAEGDQPEVAVAGDSESGGETAAVEPPKEFAAEESVLGSTDPESGFALEVRLDSVGASVTEVRPALPKYGDLVKPEERALLLQSAGTEDRTFAAGVREVDAQLQKFGLSLETVAWEQSARETGAEADTITYSYTAPDGKLRVDKKFTLPRLAGGDDLQDRLRDDPQGYTLRVDLTVVNLSDSERLVTYELQGPVGLLLENEEHTRKYRDIKLEFLDEDDAVTLAASSVVDSAEDFAFEVGASRSRIRTEFERSERWTTPFRYAGVDVQFFAALVAPIDDRSLEERLQSPLLSHTYPILIREDAETPSMSDISFRMVSNALRLEPAGGADSLTHSYALFVGPKRRELLDPEPLQASQVLDYGNYFGFIARFMHTLLDTLHGIGLPYFAAIICLTICVRGCLFPLSRKQAISAARMKELQPKLTALKEKFGDDREGFARAQMELWRKHKINPLAGCGPLLLQFPVFIGLYTTLNTAFDLRLSRFLWIDNLAAPDALFRLPFELPFLGYDFNILPVVTVVLFLAQQKMFMPPPTDEQQELQQKMMNVMTLMFGFMFWHQPAGLCIYFIASSSWGIAERKLLGTVKAPEGADIDDDAELIDNRPAKKPKAKEGPKATENSGNSGGGFMDRIRAAYEEAQRQADSQPRQNARSKGRNQKRKR